MSRKNTCPVIPHQNYVWWLFVQSWKWYYDSKDWCNMIHLWIVTSDSQSEECFIDFIPQHCEIELIRHDVLQSIEKSSLSFMMNADTHYKSHIHISLWNSLIVDFWMCEGEVKIAKNPLERNEIDWFNGIKKRWQKYSFINFAMLVLK